MNRVLRLSIPSALALGLAGLSRDALALSCDEIMNMVDVNVPTNIVVQTIKDSGDQFTGDEVACLEKRGAPDPVVAAARSMMAAAEPEVAPEPARPAREEKPRSSMDSDTDELGSRVSRRQSAYEDLPEKGGRSGAADPQKLKEAIKLYRAKKPLAASLMLYELLEDGSFPEQETKINYYLGRCLELLEMWHTAQYHYVQVVKHGPSDPYFAYALPKLVKIARYTGDDTELMRIVAKLPADAFPRSGKSELYYLKGVRYYDKDELSRAARYFDQVSSKSPVFLKSEYYKGVIYNEQGKLKSAVRSFRDVYRAEVEVYDDPRYLKEVENIKDLALINVARIYYGIERYDEASKYYNLVSHDSDYWPQALFENAWANFMRNNLNTALGQILTVQSPFFSEDEWNPELTILRSLTFFNLCEYKEVEKLLLDFEDTYRPMHAEMSEFVKSYASREGREMADQAWEAYFGEGRRKDSVLPKSLFNRILRDQDLAGIVRHLEIMEAEAELIDQQKPRWRDSIGVYLKKVIEADRERYKRRAGLLLLREMARQANKLSDLLTQSEIIRFEVVDAQRVDYQYKASNLDLTDTMENVEIDFATAVDYIYWPFNGEFWQDELGYYHYTEQGSCK